MKNLAFNPFTYIAGTKALLIGWAVMLVTACIAYGTNTRFDGVLDSHIGALPFYYCVLEALINWGMLSVTLYITGRILSPSQIRIIDVVGTTALARAPLIFIAALDYFIKDVHINKTNPLASITPSVIVVGIIGIVFIIWMIALLYNAFRISCNLKGTRAIGGFIAALLVAEVLAKWAYMYVYPS